MKMLIQTLLFLAIPSATGDKSAYWIDKTPFNSTVFRLVLLHKKPSISSNKIPMTIPSEN
ncbi:hypothetical protein CW304_30615 [Bacillus sp. UFRGS-B20]|nr:hypothetical protein CW304_30615 [Bacillus sp. UFRGS-B20]